MPAPVLIAGGGPVGVLMGLLLARRGQTVEIFERRPDPRLVPPERGRSINLALAARGLEPLKLAGVQPLVQPRLVPMRGRMLHEESGATRLVRYGQREHELIHSINRADLNRLLIEAAAHEPRLRLHFNARVTDADPHAAEFTVQGGDGATTRRTGSLLLGADGAGSALRAALERRELCRSSESPLAHDYKEFTIAPTAGGDWAMEPNALHVWPRGQFMLIALPNADRSFTATLFLPRVGRADSFAALRAPAQPRPWFARQFPDALAVLPDFETQYAAHPQGSLATLHCWPWHAARALLIGDAAHAIVPFHGQGLNCGFEDCALLAARLATAGDVAKALAEFERARRIDTDAIAAMALENYQEMRDTVRSADFDRRRELALALEREYPSRFIPRYAMVMFHAEIPYSEALRRGAVQEQLLSTLLALPQVPPAGAAEVRALLERAGL